MRSLRLIPAALVLLIMACNENFSTPVVPDSPKGAGLETLQGTSTTLPAGSIDGLAAAIAAAGSHGKVVVAAGMHTESAQVVINTPVTIEGEPGAVLAVATTPDPSATSSEAALFIRDTDHVGVSGLDIRGVGGAGNVGIGLFRTSHVTLKGNTISNHVVGIEVLLSKRPVINDNTVNASGTHGIMIISGSGAEVKGNNVDGAGFFGIWYCGAKGRASGNTTKNCFVGSILCKVPDGTVFVDGAPYGSDVPAQYWVVRDNVSSDNFTVGHLVIDGANNNTLIDNVGSNNGTYDVELAGDSFRFGFLTPQSFANQLVIGPGNENLTVKDCGSENSIIGIANIIDPVMDPCN